MTVNLKAKSIIRRDSARDECQSKSHCDLDLLDILIDTLRLSPKERSDTAETEEMYASSFESPRNVERLTIDVVTSTDDDEFIWYADTPSSCSTREGDYNARERLFFPDGSFDSDESNLLHDPVDAGILKKLSHTEAARFEFSFHRVPAPITEDDRLEVATTIDE
jgi:hypothetical protein